MRNPGDWDELYFRDYLLAHPEAAREYGKLKLSLKERYQYDRDAYPEAKGAFVRDCSEKARREFPGRYNPGCS